MRQTLHVFGYLRDTFLGVAGLRNDLVVWGNMLTPLIQFHRQEREALIDIVVKFSANPGALLFMGFNQSAPYGGETLFGELSFGDVDTRAAVTSEGTIRVK